MEMTCFAASRGWEIGREVMVFVEGGECVAKQMSPQESTSRDWARRIMVGWSFAWARVAVTMSSFLEDSLA